MALCDTSHPLAEAETGGRLHATAVAWHSAGLLILGPSGAGKSALALELMAFGAELVADDQVDLSRAGPIVQARAPATIAGQIEARGVGILRAEPRPMAEIVAVADLAQREEARLPPDRSIRLLGCEHPLFHKVDAPHFAAAVLQYLKGGRAA